MRVFFHVFVFVLLFSPTALFGAQPVIAPDLTAVIASSAADAEVPVIVTFSDQLNLQGFAALAKRVRRTALINALRQRAGVSLRPLRDFLRSHGARRERELWLINGMAATLRASALEPLRSLPGIAEIRLDGVITRPEVLPAAVAAAPEWNIAAVKAPLLWQLGFTGSGVVVANMDSGVDIAHDDLSGRFRGGANSWYDPNGEHPLVPHDADGHGTATMGIMVGGDATGSAIGVAPGARWMAVKIFNDAGEASLSNIHLGYQWLLDPDGDPATDDAPDVVNNSWGSHNGMNICDTEYQVDIQVLKAAGIAMVFAAGNLGPAPATSISPANNPGAFAVGATTEAGALDGTSSRGPSACAPQGEVYPQAAAPGVNVKVADITYGIFTTASGFASGTSFAAPHLAGAMALLTGAFPDLGLLEMEAVLKTSATDLGEPGPDNSYGYGQIDVLSAYRILAGCSDADQDGFFDREICGGIPDCDDSDADIFPGALELQQDGIDQDCNGWDLTIEIRNAVYNAGADALCVEATSHYMQSADLALETIGPMHWNEQRQRWFLTTSGLGGDPQSITVSGREGFADALTTLHPIAPCSGDINQDGSVNLLDVGLLKREFGRIDCNAPGAACTADINHDGFVNLLDAGVLKREFGRTQCPLCN